MTDETALPKLQPSLASRCLEQAYILEGQNDLERALKACDDSLEYYSDSADAHNLRGVILDALGWQSEALSAYRTAVRLDPGMGEARQNLNDLAAMMVDESPDMPVIEGQGFGRRAVAYLIDLVAIYYSSYSLAALGYYIPWKVMMNHRGRACVFDPRALTWWSVLFLWPALHFLYFAVFEGLLGTTFGKLLLNMRVVMESRKTRNFRAVMTRSLLRYEVLFLGIPAYLTMKAPKHQRVGDRIAQTIVVKSTERQLKTRRDMGRYFAAVLLYFVLVVLVSALVFSIECR